MVTGATRMFQNSGIKVVLPLSDKYTSLYSGGWNGTCLQVTRTCLQSYLEVTLGAGVVTASLGPCQTASAKLPSWL